MTLVARLALQSPPGGKDRRVPQARSPPPERRRPSGRSVVGQSALGAPRSRSTPLGRRGGQAPASGDRLHPNDGRLVEVHAVRLRAPGGRPRTVRRGLRPLLGETGGDVQRPRGPSTRPRPVAGAVQRVPLDGRHAALAEVVEDGGEHPPAQTLAAVRRQHHEAADRPRRPGRRPSPNVSAIFGRSSRGPPAPSRPVRRRRTRGSRRGRRGANRSSRTARFCSAVWATYAVPGRHPPGRAPALAPVLVARHQGQEVGLTVLREALESQVHAAQYGRLRWGAWPALSSRSRSTTASSR